MTPWWTCKNNYKTPNVLTKSYKINLMNEKKNILNFFNTNFQRIFKFLDPEKYKKNREKLESLKYVFVLKFEPIMTGIL